MIVGFLRGGCSRGGCNWGTLRIPREDWGTLGNIREDYGNHHPPLRILLHEMKIPIMAFPPFGRIFFGIFSIRTEESRFSKFLYFWGSESL